MKFMVILLLVAASHAADRQSQKSQKTEGDRKKEVSKGNSVVEKRAPAVSTVSPAITPGIEYADSKESQQDKSPTHQIYATPLPPASKISDVVSGQGPAFQSAIASHLYAPVSVYQPRLGSPTTYEVSAPVPSNLAYAEHRVSLQPSQNALQFNQKPLQNSKNLQQQLVQQPLIYPQTLGPIAQPVYQQAPQVRYQDFPINQLQVPLYPDQYQNQPVQITQTIQSDNAYSPDPRQENHQPTQRELKPQPENTINKISEKQIAAQNYVQPQRAVSFTKFSQLQPTFGLPPQQEVQYQPQPQPQPQPQLQQQLQPQPQLRQQIQPQTQYHQPQAQYQQQLQYQPQQPQFQLLQQPQIQYQPLPQYQILPQIAPTQQIPPLQYELQPEQAQQQSQPQIQYHSQPQPQALPPQQILLQPVPKAGNVAKIPVLRPGPVFLQSQYPPSHNTHDYRSNVALPTFPPVQYFGKYAQSIFGNLQH